MASMMTLIDAYIESKKNAWAKTTLASESSRLHALINALDGNPPSLWVALQPLAPYSRVTSWTRVTAFWGWLIQEGLRAGPNPYHKWRQDNALLFKNAYIPKEVGMTYDEALQKILALEDESIKAHALYILTNGLRFSESVQPQAPDSHQGRSVLGKGVKGRRIYGDGGPTLSRAEYCRFLRALRGLNLRPHQLRKLFVTRIAEKGAKEADLLKLMGWSSITTAKSYLQPQAEKELENLVHAATRKVPI